MQCRDGFARALGLTSSQFAVLMGVASQQGSRGVTIKKLSEHVALASTHVTTEVGRLERKGLLNKEANGTDRRSVLVSLTSAGETEIERMAPIVKGVNDLLFRDIDSGSLVEAQDVARKLVNNSEDALALLKDAAGTPNRRSRRDVLGAERAPERQVQEP